MVPKRLNLAHDRHRRASRAMNVLNASC
jgi:hypothetical protein